MTKIGFLEKEAITKVQVVIICVIIVVAACVATYYFTTPSPEYKRSLVIAIPEEPTGLDPQQVSWTNEIHDLVFQWLVTYDAEMNLVPDLAESFEISEDGLSVTFYLPEDAKFSNGDPLTADCVKSSVERYIDISVYAEDYVALDHVEVIDDYTAKYVFKTPPAAVWATIASNYGAIVDTEVAADKGDELFNSEPVGCGPYKVKDWVHGSHVTLVRNDHYKTNVPFVENKGPNPYIDEVIIRFIPEDLTRASELEAGTVNILRGVPIDFVSGFEENPEIKLYYVVSPGLDYILVNVRRPPVDDVRVRQAIMYAVKREDLTHVLEDTVLEWYSILSPSMSCYNSSVEDYGAAKYSYNLEKAKTLLEEAGWVDTNGDGTVDKNGKELVLELLSPTDRPALKRVAPLIKDHLSQIGIGLDIKEFAYPYIRGKTEEWDFDLALRMYSWSAPGGIIPYIVHSEYGNLTYSNPEVDHLMETAMETADETERTKLWSQVQLILLEDLPMVPLFVSKEYTGVRSDVEDLIVLPPYGQLIMNDVKIPKET